MSLDPDIDLSIQFATFTLSACQGKRRFENHPTRDYAWAMKAALLPALAVGFALIFANASSAQTDADGEAKFAAMLTNATLNGTWAPITGGKLGGEKKDAYFVVRATRKDGDNWEIVSRVTHKGAQVDFPIPAIVKFAGDTAVLILNDVRTADGKTWSARVMFHNDVYAGSWWGAGQKGGAISGTITRGG